MKDAAQDITQDVAQDEAQDVSGAKEDGSVEVLTFPSPSSSGGTHALHSLSAPHACP